MFITVKSKLGFLGLICLAVWGGNQFAQVNGVGSDHHRMSHLPHYKDAKHPTIPFKHYAGHMPLSTGENMFYWFTESQSQPDLDPVVLWLNGGPGCSSLGGFFTENGPFVVQADLSVRLNPYSWNRHANMVWMESPAGVGFSGPKQKDDYYNDETTSDRNYKFIQAFFAKYPSLKGRDFYITGESYAGIYIPVLVDLLLKHPIDGVHLKGFAIGNPFTDAAIDGNAYVDYYYTHGLISLENYREMVGYCSGQIGKCMYTSTNCSAPCSASIHEGLMRANFDQFNQYDIYGDKCLLQNGQAGLLRFTKKKPPVDPHLRSVVGPCTDQFTEAYLNLPEVQAAIHIGVQSKRWTDCNNHIGQIYSRMRSSLPIYPSILGKGLRVLIYSGDADSVVNFMGTERWISNEGLGLQIKKKWKAWFGPDNQLAGYVQKYYDLTFMTVKGAGHMVPAVKPLHAVNMFECFIYDDKCNFHYPIDAIQKASGVGISTHFQEKQPEDKSSSVSPLALLALSMLLVGLIVVVQRRRSIFYGYNRIIQ